jgi:AraC family transcriptional regulator, regulatory protein of adaptative response / DNA-3-methyladenine glycosylase II
VEVGQYQQARMARDSRFDGVFYVAVKTTGIFCRPICPANAPKEINVEYFHTASEALVSGYRPCLRCRPEAAPFSPAWNGTQTTVQRALTIIHQQGFQGLTLNRLAERLGITDRYLRILFKKWLGVAPKHYLLHQQILFAKALLHQTHLPIQEVAYACGFNNVRRFNDSFKKLTHKTPSEERKLPSSQEAIRLELNYQPPFAWQHWHDFVAFRQIEGVEQLGQSSYSRTFSLRDETGQYCHGFFKAVRRPDKHGFNVSIEIDDSQYLYPAVQKIRQVFDLNANIEVIKTGLLAAGLPDTAIVEGLRIPACWDTYEAGIRAILGQQVSVKAAVNLLNQLVKEVGETRVVNDIERRWFPTPEQLAKADLSFLKIPDSRRQTLTRLAKYCVENPQVDPEKWIELKGIGPWTIEYAKMRGLSDTDIWLDTDLGIKKSLDIYPSIQPEQARPWRTYLTFNMWNML